MTMGELQIWLDNYGAELSLRRSPSPKPPRYWVARIDLPFDRSLNAIGFGGMISDAILAAKRLVEEKYPQPEVIGSIEP